MIRVGINGLGRIGKCVFIQLLQNKNVCIKAVNAPSLSIDNLKTYLCYDSNHKYDTSSWDFKIIDDSHFSICGHKIRLFKTRSLADLEWSAYDVDCVIDATGVFLTHDKICKHGTRRIVMCAPPKDDTPQYIVGVNDVHYKDEQVVSNASCTTNCIAPILKYLDDNYGVEKANFTTIHAATASQNVTDNTRYHHRTCRSIIDNIIPHKTGASKSIVKLIPSLDGTIYGTSLRIPVSNVSIVDLNVTLNKDVELVTLIDSLNSHKHISVNYDKFLVSGDFKTNPCPTIIDNSASMQLSGNELKLMIWYDNEWSYSKKVIELMEHVCKRS